MIGSYDSVGICTPIESENFMNTLVESEDTMSVEDAVDYVSHELLNLDQEELTLEFYGDLLPRMVAQILAGDVDGLREELENEHAQARYEMNMDTYLDATQNAGVDRDILEDSDEEDLLHFIYEHDNFDPLGDYAIHAPDVLMGMPMRFVAVSELIA